MKICNSCSHHFSEESWRCPKCTFEPPVERGVLTFAPDLAYVNTGYDPSWYEELATLEEGNFWFVTRNKLILWALQKFCPELESFLELGCGTGYVIRDISARFANCRLIGSELCVEGLEYAEKRVKGRATLVQMDATNIPFKEEFDGIGIFDVIEHIEDDGKVLMETHKALKPGGFLTVSVPQHMFLWSKYDELGCHFRRYKLGELENKMKDAGFHVLYTSSFNTLLLPFMLLSRNLKKKSKHENIDVLDELRIPSAINFVLKSVLNVEVMLTKLGVRWPIGGSRLILARKN